MKNQRHQSLKPSNFEPTDLVDITAVTPEQFSNTAVFPCGTMAGIESALESLHSMLSSKRGQWKKRLIEEMIFILYLFLRKKQRGEISSYLEYVPLNTAVLSEVFGKGERFGELRDVTQSLPFLEAEPDRNYYAGGFSRTYRLGETFRTLLLEQGSCSANNDNGSDANGIELLESRFIRQWRYRQAKRYLQTVLNSPYREEYARQITLSSRLSVNWDSVPLEKIRIPPRRSSEQNTADNAGNDVSENADRIAFQTLRDIERIDRLHGWSIAHGRFFTPFHRLKKNLRRCVLLSREPITELFDVTACFVTLTAILYARKTGDGTFLDRLKSMDIYQMIADYHNEYSGTPAYTLTRDEIKPVMMRYLFSNRTERQLCMNNQGKQGEIMRDVHGWFRWYPEIRDFITDYPSRYSGNKYKSQLSTDCQELEAEIMFGRVLPELNRLFPQCCFLSLHDGIFIRTSDYSAIQDRLNARKTPEEMAGKIFWNAVAELLNT